MYSYWHVCVCVCLRACVYTRESFNIRFHFVVMHQNFLHFFVCFLFVVGVNREAHGRMTVLDGFLSDVGLSGRKRTFAVERTDSSSLFYRVSCREDHFHHILTTSQELPSSRTSANQLYRDKHQLIIHEYIMLLHHTCHST